MSNTRLKCESRSPWRKLQKKSQPRPMSSSGSSLWHTTNRCTNKLSLTADKIQIAFQIKSKVDRRQDEDGRFLREHVVQLSQLFAKERDREKMMFVMQLARNYVEQPNSTGSG